ncbi:restriction endonuclease subunit S [Xanthomonas arboricola]|uniref:restriction endonuclease subunit S n=1 Tax=Xanthomonas arboricola TaxID=56448 RepID=UPI0012DB5D55|nr:restriction endonuclease subunit S [Xanthomonas arboricola]
MSELPAGWATFSIADIGGLAGGKTPSKANPAFWSSRDIPWISPKDMKKLYLEDSEDRISKVALSDAGMALHPAKSILMVTRSGILQHTFPVALARVDSTVNQDIKVIAPHSEIDTIFLLYSLRAFGQIILQRCSKAGTTVQSIDSDKLEAFPFPLPPLAEQKRIAQKLDALLAQVDTLKARIDTIPALLKRFRQTVMSTAVSGKLTENWRRARYGAHDNRPFTLPSKKLGLLARFIDYRGKTPEKVGSGIPLITAKNIRKGYISREPQEFIRLDAYESWMTRGIPQLGDLVITTEAPLGNVATIDIKGRFALAQRAICLHFYEGFSSSFAAIVLQSPMLQEELLRRSTGTTVKGIKASVLKEIELPNPALEEQTEIVRRVEQLFAYADQLEAKVTAAQQRIDALTQSLLAKAFRGELVPQDPSDEPASALLERIRAQRAASPKPKRGRKAATS